MPTITDPDSLDQGGLTSPSDAAWTASSGSQTTITGAATLPAVASGDYFEVRDHSVAGNNGLYQASGTPTTSSITCDKVDGTNPVNASAEAVSTYGNTTTEKSVMIDTDQKRIYLLEQGNLDSTGVTLQALYSFLKEEWKNDAALIPHQFPMVAITPEQFEFSNSWVPRDVTSPSIRTRKIIRTGGWSEIDTNAVVVRQFPGIVTLGSFEDAADVAYYQLGTDSTDTSAAINFDFAGPVNEAIKVYEDYGVPTNIAVTTNNVITKTGGTSFITFGFRVGGRVQITNAEDAGNNGTFTLTAVTADALTVSGTPLTNNADDDTMRLFADNRNSVRVYLRIRDADPNGKTFAFSDLSAIGVSAVDNKVFRFPVTNATDLKIAETDANIASNSPYTQIEIRYFDQNFSLDVDTPGSPRDFSIVVDGGTFSGVDGVSNGTTSFTTAEAGIPGTTYDGGTLTIHEGTDKGDHAITTASGGTVTLGSALTGSETALSFTLQRSTPVNPTIEQIYEKVQYQLRQAADVDATDQTVAGRTAQELMNFVGDRLVTKEALNPNTGTTDGVAIMGFDPNDTNDLTLTDNTGTARTFPFVAAGSINFNTNLVNDGSASYWMFFSYTERFTNTGFGLSAASADTATLDSSTTDLVAELADGDFINLTGFTDSTLNGIYVLTGAPAGTGPWTAAVRRVDGTTLANETAGASVSLDKNPVNSPDAILVDNNAGADITGAIGASSVAFDFDYDGNVQGGRTASTNADVTIRAIGLTTAQFVETTGTITQNTGLVFSLVSALERNYANP